MRKDGKQQKVMKYYKIMKREKPDVKVLEQCKVTNVLQL